MLTGPVVPPPIGCSRFFELVAQPILDHILQFACNFDGRCLEKTMGHLVELGKIVFGVEMLAECSIAPPDTYEKKFRFKQFQTVSKIVSKNLSKNVSKSFSNNI